MTKGTDRTGRQAAANAREPFEDEDINTQRAGHRAQATMGALSPGGDCSSRLT